MKTVVFQSYRTERQPDWIKTCMASVRSWADMRGYEYRFEDDSFLDLAPAWYRERSAGEMCPVTDLARLVMARQLLADGWERTIWVDADVLVFAPHLLSVDGLRDFALCLEVWPSVDAGGQLHCSQRTNNSISVFTRENRQLDFLIDACHRIALSKPRLGKLDVGTAFLTGLGRILPIQLIANAGTFSPAIMCDIASGEDRFLPAYAAHLPAPLVCANLCHSLVGEAIDGWQADDEVCAAVIEKCLATQGAVVNRWIRRA